MARKSPLGLASVVLFLAVPAVRPEPITLTGRVTGPTDRPATVRLELVPLVLPDQPAPVPAPTAKAGGEILGSAPEAGFWRLIARAPGAAPAALDLLPLADSAALPPLRLSPARRLRIAVTNPAGRPIPGAVVRIEAVPAPGDPALRWFPAPSDASTGENGSALLDVSPSAPLLLDVIAPGFLPERREIPPGADDGVAVRLRPGVTRVVEARSPRGRPISGVTVVTDIGLQLGTTDGEGRLPVTVPMAGETWLRLLAADCRWAEGMLRSDSTGVFTLHPPRSLRGRVLDRRSRQPLGGAWVWREGLPSCSARTAGDGGYTLALPGFGEVRLRAAASGYRPEALALGDTPTSEAPLLTLAPLPGRPAPELLALSGRVVDPAGDPLAGVRVQALSAANPAPGEGDAGRHAVTSGAGLFLLSGLREGEGLALRFEGEGFAARTLPGVRVPLDEPLTVVLTPGARIAGRVVDESGDPVDGVKLVLSQDLRDGGTQGRRGRPVSAGETDAAGRFELTDLAPGSFRLVALNAGFLPETREGLTLAEGERVDGIDLVLRRGSTIEGRISAPDGSPAAGAKVVVLDAGEDLGLGLAGRPTAVADAGGRYEIGGVSEGDRTVLAELAGFQPARERLRVEVGANRLDLRLREGFEVSGRVSGPEGPVAGAVLRLLPRDDGSTVPPPPGAAGPDGRFRILAVAEGSYRLEVEKHGYTMADPSLDVRIAGAPVQDLEVRLERGGAIAGRILGLGPEDLSQVRIVATSSELPGRAGKVGPDGRYRIEGVGPGAWTVLASLPQGTQAGGRVLLGVGQAEAVFDLEFTTGFVLSGRVEYNGEAVGGAVVLVEGEEGTGGNTVTAPDGGFRLGGLRPGTYGVTALDTRSQARLDLRIEIDGDREIVLRLPEPPKESGRL